MSINSNKLKDEEKPKYFKQLNVYKTINIPCVYIENSREIDAVGKLKILTTKFIDTCEGVSYEGQCLSGKKLIILGTISIKLIIPYWDGRHRECIERSYIDFSTFIVVPKDINNSEPISLKYLIEDITAKAITPHEVLISTTLLLHYQDEYIE